MNIFTLVNIYNYDKPHCKLQSMTPISFEKSIHLQNQNPGEKKSSKILEPTIKDKSTNDNMPKTSKQTVNHF